MGKAVSELTSIILEVNFDKDSFPRVAELLDYLAGRGLSGKLAHVLFSPISPVPHAREGARPSAEVPCLLMSLVSTRELIALQALALQNGFSVDTAVVAHVCEMMSKRSNFVVDPEGRLYRCGGFAGRKEFSFGTIDGEKRDPWMGRELWRRCASCAYAPLCGDGCLFGSYVRWGDPLRLNCGKESMEHLVPESLKLTYLQKAKKKQA